MCTMQNNMHIIYFPPGTLSNCKMIVFLRDTISTSLSRYPPASVHFIIITSYSNNGSLREKAFMFGLRD